MLQAASMTVRFLVFILLFRFSPTRHFSMRCCWYSGDRMRSCTCGADSQM
jgi:hypothetical protein